MEQCEYEFCDRDAKAKGLCASHFQQQRRGKELTPLQSKRRKKNETYCPTCDTQKAREDFYIKTTGKLQYECKECMKKRAKARRDKATEALKRLAELEAS